MLTEEHDSCLINQEVDPWVLTEELDSCLINQ